MTTFLRLVNLHRGNLQRVYLSLPCFTRTAADEVCVNFAKNFQAIGFFEVFQMRTGVHPAFSRRTNPEINHRREQNGQILKSKTFLLQKNMCDVRRKQTNSAYVRSRNGNSRILLAKRDNGKPYLEVILPANFELTGANFSEFEKFLFLFEFCRILQRFFSVSD